MFKKVLIASVAVVIGLAVTAKVFPAVRRAIEEKIATRLERGKPDRNISREIQRLRDQVEGLQKEDDAYFDKVARQRLDVRAREKELLGDADKKTKGTKAELADLRTRLSNLRALVKDVKDAEKSGERTVSYNGENFSLKQVNRQIDLDWARYKPLKATVESQESYLVALKTALAQNEEKVMNLQKTRQDMLTQLQTLENELNELRQAKAGRAALVDDSKYGRVQKSIEAVKQKVAIEKEKLTIKGSMGKGPIEQSEEARAKQALRQQEMDAEFAGAAPKN